MRPTSSQSLGNGGATSKANSNANFDEEGPTLRHIMQRTNMDCVVTCAAIVANSDYGRAADLSPVPVGDRPLFPVEIRKILRVLTSTVWVGPLPTLSPKISRFADRKSETILMIRKHRWGSLLNRERQLNHVVVVCNRLIYDPEFAEPQTYSEYERNDWFATGYYRPWSLKRLRETQGINRKSDSVLWDQILKD